MRFIYVLYRQSFHLIINKITRNDWKEKLDLIYCLHQLSSSDRSKTRWMFDGMIGQVYLIISTGLEVF